jgi:hypothetical protein
VSAPAVPVWHCDLKGTEQLTVGVPFEMSCSGDIPVTWNGAPKIVLPEKAEPYSLVILSAKKLEATSAEFAVTSYRTGDLKPEIVRVMTGEAGFEASGLTFKVQSVLKPNEQPKPYGPYGPFYLPMPMWVWIAVALLVASLSSCLWLWFRRIQNKKRLVEDLAKHTNVLTPSAKLHKDLRGLSRKLIHEKDAAAAGAWNATLDEDIRIFLLRDFEFLALRVSRGQLLLNWKKKNRDAYAEHSAGLEKIFSEMDRFQVHAGEHKAAEYEQILNLARLWCDRIEKWKLRRRQ